MAVLLVMTDVTQFILLIISSFLYSGVPTSRHGSCLPRLNTWADIDCKQSVKDSLCAFMTDPRLSIVCSVCMNHCHN